MKNGNELYHYGVLGMKWGRRIASGPGPRIGVTKGRTVNFAKKDLDKIKSGEHLSIGLSKKRQKLYDERDMKTLEFISKHSEKINNGKAFVQKLFSRI